MPRALAPRPLLAGPTARPAQASVRRSALPLTPPWRTVAPACRALNRASSSCRHRAWEQRRAADSGLAAVEVVDRVVEVVRVKKVVEERRVQVPVSRTPRSAREWVDVLNRLEWALQSNRMELDDLAEIEPPLARVVAVYRARSDKLHRRRGRQ